MLRDEGGVHGADLRLGLRGLAGIVDDEVGAAHLLGEGHLARDAPLRLRAGEAVPRHEAAELRRGLRVHDDHAVHLARGADLDEERDVEHDQPVEALGRPRVEDGLPPGRDGGMRDPLQDLAARGIGEDERPEALPVELAVRPRHVRAERLDDGAPGGLVRRDDLAGEEVGVDEPAPQLHQLPADRRLAGRDPAGEPDEQERARPSRSRGVAGRARVHAQSGSRNSPRATVTAEPPTSTRVMAAASPSTRANSTLGRWISAP